LPVSSLWFIVLCGYSIYFVFFCIVLFSFIFLNQSFLLNIWFFKTNNSIKKTFESIFDSIAQFGKTGWDFPDCRVAECRLQFSKRHMEVISDEGNSLCSSQLITTNILLFWQVRFFNFVNLSENYFVV
jgi:hypothetical protein